MLNNWPNSKKNFINRKYKENSANYIRLLLIEVEQQILPSNKITLYWRNHQNNQISSESYLNQADAALIFPTQNWLAQALLLHPEYNQDDHDWYIEPQKNMLIILQIKIY